MVLPAAPYQSCGVKLLLRRFDEVQICEQLVRQNTVVCLDVHPDVVALGSRPDTVRELFAGKNERHLELHRLARPEQFDVEFAASTKLRALDAASRRAVDEFPGAYLCPAVTHGDVCAVVHHQHLAGRLVQHELVGSIVQQDRDVTSVRAGTQRNNQHNYKCR